MDGHKKECKAMGKMAGERPSILRDGLTKAFVRSDSSWSLPHGDGVRPTMVPRTESKLDREYTAIPRATEDNRHRAPHERPAWKPHLQPLVSQGRSG